MNIKLRSWLGVIGLLCLACAGAVARQGNTAPPNSKPKSKQSWHIGQFQLTNEGGEVFFESSSRTKMQQMELTGKRITVTSENYDITAQKISLQQDTRINKVTTAKATVNVRIAVRNDDQNLVLTCDSAVYHYATAESPTHIDVDGNVRAVIRNKNFTQDGPLILTGDSGVVEIPDSETTRVRLKNPTGNGTPIEPETRKTPAKNTP
jgi:hypothetical protein